MWSMSITTENQLQMTMKEILTDFTKNKLVQFLGAGQIETIGLDSSAYGTHSLRRTKVALIYKQTKNLRAVQILLGHTNLESTVRYLGVEVEDALELSENMEI